MIHDLDEGLRTLLLGELPKEWQVNIEFDQPRRRCALRRGAGWPRAERELELRQLVGVPPIERRARLYNVRAGADRSDDDERRNGDYGTSPRYGESLAQRVKPTPGLEPGTPSLRVKCSTS